VEVDTIIAVIAAAVAVVSAAFAGKQARAAEHEASAAEDAAASARQSVKLEREGLQLAKASAEAQAEREEEATRPKLEPLAERRDPPAFHVHETSPQWFAGWLVNHGPGSAIVDEVRLEIGASTTDGHPYDSDGQPVQQVLVAEGAQVNVRVQEVPELSIVIREQPPLHLEVRYCGSANPAVRWWVGIDLEPALAPSPGRKAWRVTGYNTRRA
jgi:hypothetical protein